MSQSYHPEVVSERMRKRREYLVKQVFGEIPENPTGGLWPHVTKGMKK